MEEQLREPRRCCTCRRSPAAFIKKGAWSPPTFGQAERRLGGNAPTSLCPCPLVCWHPLLTESPRSQRAKADVLPSALPLGVPDRCQRWGVIWWTNRKYPAQPWKRWQPSAYYSEFTEKPPRGLNWAMAQFGSPLASLAALWGVGTAGRRRAGRAVWRLFLLSSG